MGEVPRLPLVLTVHSHEAFNFSLRFPALVIDPKMPKTGMFHNGIPIPAPPEKVDVEEIKKINSQNFKVLNIANFHTDPHYLILFFDTRRTWQWLLGDKLELLGVDSGLA